VNAEAAAAGARQYNSFVATPQTRRSHAEVAGFFDGLDLIEPGLVQAHQWRPDPGSSAAGSISGWAGSPASPDRPAGSA
jgi:S-adenosyl methyltransferase